MVETTFSEFGFHCTSGMLLSVPILDFHFGELLVSHYGKDNETCGTTGRENEEQKNAKSISQYTSGHSSSSSINLINKENLPKWRHAHFYFLS
jgi:hypothetical protein